MSIESKALDGGILLPLNQQIVQYKPWLDLEADCPNFRALVSILLWPGETMEH